MILGIITLFVVLFGVILIGVPLAMGLCVTSMMFIVFFTDVPLMIMVQRITTSLDGFTMMSAPLFVLAALLMDKAGIGDSIMRLATALVGKLKGSLAAVNVVTSMLFAGISGTASADTAFVGGMMIPSMIKKGYDADFSAAITAASSTIGILIPPSIPMILYGVMANLSISELFIAGFIPGILVGTFMIIATTIISYKRDYEVNPETFTFKERLHAIIGGWPIIGMMFIIIGGILAGIFTPTEAAATVVLYALLIGFFYTKTLKLKDLPEIMVKTSIMSGATMIIIGVADLLGWVITNAKISSYLIGPLVDSFQGSPALFMWLVVVILVVAGTFLHGVAMLVVIVPLLLPTAGVLGIHPLQFAMVVIMSWGIGQQTPPVGSALFMCCKLADVSVWEITKENIYFIGCILVVCALVIHVPAVVTWLPSFI